jgi:LacI family transcriptional regulator
MEKKITMQEIADRLGISKVTVSKAMRGSKEISKGMKEKILQTAADMGYLYASGSRDEIHIGSYCIGVITSDRYFGKGDYFYVDLYRLLSKELESLGYSAMLHILDHGSEDEGCLPVMISEGKVDGIIVLGQLASKYLEKLLFKGLPTIFLDFYNNSLHNKVDSIITDNFFGAYEITNLLIELGHKRIMYVGNLKLTSSIQDRYLGFFKAMLEKGLECYEGSVIEDRNDKSEWLEIELPQVMPEAFVCNCDKTAEILVKTLKAKGYRVPEDVSVVGFDDSIHAMSCDPRITTVRVNIEQMAATAAKIIIKKIKKSGKRYGRVLVEGTVVKRDSAK